MSKQFTKFVKEKIPEMRAGAEFVVKTDGSIEYWIIPDKAADHFIPWQLMKNRNA